MKRWFKSLRFLWEEEIALPEEVPRAGPGEPTGVPRFVQRAAHAAFAGAVAVTLMGQVIGVRLVAPVDASPSYKQQCEKGCENTYNQCTKTAEGSNQTCQKSTEAAFRSCKAGCPKNSKAADNCNRTCEVQHTQRGNNCQSQHKSSLSQCVQNRDHCDSVCDKGK